MFYFVRHGQTDYSGINTKIYQGFGTNLAPLSAEGEAQIERAAQDERLRGAELILTSPYTRAVQTAAILSRVTGARIAVETDLHEWLANKDYLYEQDETAEAYYLEYEAAGGAWPPGEERPWECAEAIRARVLPVLQKYAGYRKVIVAGHGLMIQAVCGGKHPDNGGIVEYELT